MKRKGVATKAKCEHGKWLETNILDIKILQNKLVENIDKEWKEELRECLRGTKRWNKQIEFYHKSECLGETYLIIQQMQEERKSRKKEWVNAHPEFMKLLKEYSSLGRL